jgi:hypothetical protein
MDTGNETDARPKLANGLPVGDSITRNALGRFIR